MSCQICWVQANKMWTANTSKAAFIPDTCSQVQVSRMSNLYPDTIYIHIYLSINVCKFWFFTTCYRNATLMTILSPIQDTCSRWRQGIQVDTICIELLLHVSGVNMAYNQTASWLIKQIGYTNVTWTRTSVLVSCMCCSHSVCLYSANLTITCVYCHEYIRLSVCCSLVSTVLWS